jgi:hypothetical protein
MAEDAAVARTKSKRGNGEGPVNFQGHNQGGLDAGLARTGQRFTSTMVRLVTPPSCERVRHSLGGSQYSTAPPAASTVLRVVSRLASSLR